VEFERPQAEFAELVRALSAFVGTFDDVIKAMPRTATWASDVLYFPPIHDRTTNRKGRNNALKAGPDDPGSPYAIGGRRGWARCDSSGAGHAGGFRRLVAAAK